MVERDGRKITEKKAGRRWWMSRKSKKRKFLVKETSW
jgi:hypothetical protein